MTQAILPARTTRSGDVQSAVGAIWRSPILMRPRLNCMRQLFRDQIAHGGFRALRYL